MLDERWGIHSNTKAWSKRGKMLRMEFPAYKKGGSAVKTSLRTSASLFVRESRLATDDTYQPCATRG
jgi:hypothetical protein